MYAIRSYYAPLVSADEDSVAFAFRPEESDLAERGEWPVLLGRAVGVYQAGAFFGIGLAFMVGGLVIRAVTTSGGFELPVLGAIRPWQLAFMAVGIPGVFVALLMWTAITSYNVCYTKLLRTT